MLDVHPAHHAASTWRDFFIHIATIARRETRLLFEPVPNADCLLSDRSCT